MVVKHDNHPVYRPPLDADLPEWVLQHGFSLNKNLGYIDFNGLQAVGFENARTATKYSAEHYFFLKNGQLFQIAIYHTELRQDNKVEEIFKKFYL